MENKKTIQALTRSVMAIVMFVTAANVYTYESKDAPIEPQKVSVALIDEPLTLKKDRQLHKFKSVVDILPEAVVDNLTLKAVRELNCMALNNYYEAATEGVKGMQAVSQVVMNRMEVNGFPATPCGVIYQRKQFSWTFQKTLPKLDIESSKWKQAVHVAKQMYIDNHKVKGLEGALFYHADYVNPKWANVVKIRKIGAHIFYGKA